jgi:hypothetical protein
LFLLSYNRNRASNNYYHSIPKLPKDAGFRVISAYLIQGKCV